MIPAEIFRLDEDKVNKVLLLVWTNSTNSTFSKCGSQSNSSFKKTNQMKRDLAAVLKTSAGHDMS